MSLNLEPLGPAIGVRVHGLDLGVPVGMDDAFVLRIALEEHGLLLVRDQQIDGEQQARFAGIFGTVVTRERNLLAGGNRQVQHVSNTRADGILGQGELDFHMDQLFHPEPLAALTLYAVEIPEAGGDTLFCDARAAYDAMPEPLRTRVAGLRCRHAYSFSGAIAREWNIESSDQVPSMSAIHPMAPAHPRTGRRALWVNKMTTVEVLGLSAEDGAALMAEVRSYLATGAPVYRHRWRAGDLLLWDNRSLMHARTAFDASLPRTLRRCTVL